jgi:hypothetical protein
MTDIEVDNNAAHGVTGDEDIDDHSMDGELMKETDISPQKDGKLVKQIIKEGKGLTHRSDHRFVTHS